MPEKLLNAHEVAEVLGVCEATIYNYVKNKRLPVIRLGTGPKAHFRVSQEALQAFIERGGVQPVKHDVRDADGST